jgi:hypothetical protein
MILDNLLMFTGTSNGATGTQASGPNVDSPTTGTQVSANVVDLAILNGLPLGYTTPFTFGPSRDLGIGDDPAMKVLVLVTTAFVTGTSLAVALQGAPDSGNNVTPTPGSWYTFYTSPTVLTASLTIGQRLLDMDMPRPPPGNPVPRFLRLQYTSAGSAFTAGSVEGTIVLDRHDQMYNASNNAQLGGYPAGIIIAN